MRQTMVRGGVCVLVCAGLVTIACSRGTGASNQATQASPPAVAQASPAAVVQAGQVVSVSNGLGRTLLCSLDPGEEILVDECSLVVAAGKITLNMVTVKGSGPSKAYYAIRNCQRQGPFKTADEAFKAAHGGPQSLVGCRVTCATYRPRPAPEGARLEVERTSAGEGYKFKDASFGPHQIVFSQQITPDGGVAYITAADKDKAWFQSSDGRKVSFGGIPGEFKFSPDGRHAAVLVQGRYSMNEMDQLSKTPEKMMAAAGEMNKKYLYTIDGKSFGPFEDVSYWYAQTSDDLFYRVGDQVFRNGSPMIKADSFDECGFYPTPDGRAHAIVTYSKITFSDGASYPSPLDVFVYQDQGKTLYRWLSLENKKDLVVYQRAM